MSWIPLHIHSQYSILDSTLSIQDIVEKGSQFGMKAIALTDFSNMFGAIDFYKACISANIKPIIGCEVMVAPDSRHEKKKKPGCPVGYPLILIAKNREGYRNLCKISSIGYLEGFYYTPRVDQEILETYSKGLICLSGPIHSRLSQCIIQDRIKDLENQLEWYLKTFGQDFYFEVQRHKMSDQNIYNEGIEKESWLYQSYLDRVKQQEKIIDQFMELSIKNGVSCVATNDTRYMFREDWKAHEILMNIQSGEPCEIIEWDSFGNQKGRSLNPKRKIVPTHELYFKSPEEIKELFNDIPAVIDSSVQIAEKCSLELDFETKFYPVFIPPHLEGKQFKENERIKEAAQFLKDLCNEGIKSRYNSECLEEVRKKYPNQDPLEVVKARLENELEIIISKGMCDYLLIVYDFIAWAKKEKIPVGPGRGSGAGSIILYLITRLY